MSRDLSRYLRRDVSDCTALHMTTDAAVADCMGIQHVRGPLLQSVVLKVSLLEAGFCVHVSS